MLITTNYINVQGKEINYHDISCNNDINLLKSGLLLATMVVLSYLIFIIKGKNILLLPILGILIAVLAITKSRLLYVIVNILITIGNVINRFTNPILLSCIYVVAVVPISLLLNIFTKDNINLNYNLTCDSYWIKRSFHFESNNFYNQY